MEPTQEILNSCNHIENLLKAFKNETENRTISRRFEYNIDAATSIRHMAVLINSIVCLAKNDLSYVISANMIARGVVETAFKTLWIQKPMNPFEKESRWVLYLETAVEHFKKLSEITHLKPEMRNDFKRKAKFYGGFSKKLRPLLQEEGISFDLDKYPSMNQMMKQVGNPEAYFLYSILSSFTHCNFSIVDFYCKNLGMAKEQGLFFKPQDWILSFNSSCVCYFLVCETFLSENDIFDRKHFTKQNYLECHETILSIK